MITAHIMSLDFTSLVLKQGLTVLDAKNAAPKANAGANTGYVAILAPDGSFCDLINTGKIKSLSDDVTLLSHLKERASTGGLCPVVTPETTVNETSAIFTRDRVQAVAVVDDMNRLLGIVRADQISHPHSR